MHCEFIKFCDERICFFVIAFFKVFMGLAWALFAPMAVIAAANKKNIDCGKMALPGDAKAVDNWFNIHKICNSLAVTFTYN